MRSDQGQPSVDTDQQGQRFTATWDRFGAESPKTA